MMTVKINSILKKLFFPLFFFLLALSFFLIESDFAFFLYSAWSIFALVYFYIWRIKISLETDVILIIAFSLTIILSTFFSHQLYFSLKKLLFYLITTELYLLFRFLPKKNKEKKQFFEYLTLLSIVLNTFVLVTTFIPETKNSFPGMNLLVKTYGHNHYVSFLLITIPIFWLDLFSNKNKKSIFLLISSYLILFLSFARVALLISFAQLLLILVIRIKNNKQQKIDKLLKILIFSFSSILIFYFLLSSKIMSQESWLCNSLLTEKKLCEPIEQNNRVVYWEKAGKIFLNNPLWGYGLKTFMSAEHRLNTDVLSQTSYAHNIFLHLLAEAGLMPTIFFSFFIIYFFVEIKKTEKKDLSFYLTNTAITASLINALFDFDLNFFVIFLLTLILIALNLEKKQQKQINLKLFFISIAIFSNLLLINYLLVNTFIKNKNTKFLLFPQHSKARRDVLLIQKNFSKEENLKLFEIYKYDPLFLYSLKKNKNISDELEIKINKQLLDITLISFIKSLDFSESSLEVNNHIIQNLSKKIENNELSIKDSYWTNYKDRLNLAKQLIDVAEKNYKQGKLIEADRAYQLAIILDEFILGKAKISFLEETDPNKLADFLLITTLKTESMHENFAKYMNIYQKTLIHLFKTEEIDVFIKLTNKILKQEENYAHFIFKEINAIGLENEKLEKHLIKIDKEFKEHPVWKEAYQ